MSSDYLKEPLEPFLALFDDFVTESVRKHLSWEWGYRDTCALAFQDITEVLEVRVPATHDRVFQLEGRDVGSALDLVRRVPLAGGAMSYGFDDLSFRY